MWLRSLRLFDRCLLCDTQVGFVSAGSMCFSLSQKSTLFYKLLIGIWVARQVWTWLLFLLFLTYALSFTLWDCLCSVFFCFRLWHIWKKIVLHMVWTTCNVCSVFGGNGVGGGPAKQDVLVQPSAVSYSFPLLYQLLSD